MHLGQRSSRAGNSYQGFQWECGQSFAGFRCRHTKAITTGSFFDDVRMSWLTVWDLILHWFFQTPVIAASSQLKCGKDAAIDWYSFCREICYEIVSEMDICIGGVGLHVEIDETHLFKRKYNRGRILAAEHVWCFGGICRESKEAFLHIVPDRSGNTLWPIIKRRVHPGTIILTDSARVYNSLHQAERGGFQHYQVNHKRNFVLPSDSNVHTNTIERIWGLLKGMVKGPMNDAKLEMYLGEFIYRRHFFKSLSSMDKQTSGRFLKIFLEHVREIYPGLQNV
ncbi:putative transposase-like protein [Orchesella cincta]|uniref:Putative transposase-like protein n=1 Tax=Orchesella cincta TaxID=48709 RepID=A0A1D2M6U5_ORCCI|nr:putative transposase-like protein [Orchesella cincta]